VAFAQQRQKHDKTCDEEYRREDSDACNADGPYERGREEGAYGDTGSRQSTGERSG
jgi:hypothetical protein